MFYQNPEIDIIIDDATQIAKEHSHNYVTVEHVTLALINFVPFNEVLVKFGTDVESLKNDLADYLVDRTELVTEKSSSDPKKTNSLERIFNIIENKTRMTNRANA